MATKKLEMGYDKCFQIHVGSNSSKVCPKLSVHGEEMKTASSEKYLGNVINNSGKIEENIQSRRDKGMGTINSIISMIEEISFGEHVFQIGLLFRNSMLINSMLCSSEVLYGITNAHIQTLEECDKALFTQLFSVPVSCSYEAFFYESGALPVRHILIGRRLVYYWTGLNRSSQI